MLQGVGDEGGGASPCDVSFIQLPPLPLHPGPRVKYNLLGRKKFLIPFNFNLLFTDPVCVSLMVRLNSFVTSQSIVLYCNVGDNCV